MNDNGKDARRPLNSGTIFRLKESAEADVSAH